MNITKSAKIRNISIKKHFSSFFYTVSLFLRRLSSALIVFLLARYITVNEFGLYTSFLNIAGILLLITNFGFNEFLLVKSKNNKKDVHDSIHGFILLSILLFLVIIICSLFFNINNKFFLILILVKVFLENQIGIILLTYFQSINDLKFVSITNILYSILIIFAALISNLLKLNLEIFLIINIFIAFLIAFVQLIIIKVNLLAYLKKFLYFLKTLDKSLIYFGFVMITVALYMQTPSLIVSCFLPKDEVAIYFAAYNISSILLLISVSQLQKILPKLISFNITNIGNLIKSNLISISIINLIIIIIFIAFGKQFLLLIYSDSLYLKSYTILLVLSGSNFFQSINGILATLLTARGFQKQKLIFQIEFIIFGLILAFILINKFGAVGAALTYLLMYVYGIIRYLIFIKKRVLLW